MVACTEVTGSSVVVMVVLPCGEVFRQCLWVVGLHNVLGIRGASRYRFVLYS